MSDRYAKLTPEQRASQLEATRRWRKRNPRKARASKKAWLAANPGKNAEHCRNFRKAHPDKAKAAIERWKRANPERAADIALRGIRKRQARLQGATCDCCAPISFKFIYLQARSLKMEVDHVQPLSKDGKHCLRNLQLLEPRDNRRKAARWAPNQSENP